MAKSKICVYIVTVCSSEASGVRVTSFIGNEDQAKKHLIKLIKDDMANDPENFDFAPVKICEIETDKDGTLSGEAVYSDYHIEYQATVLKNIIEDDWVTGRNPDKNGCYLVTVNYSGSCFVTIRDFAKDLYKVDDYRFIKYKGKKHAGWFDYHDELGFFEETDVIAWQPLPEPYKGEEE